METEIEERQYKRFVVLYALYKESHGATTLNVNLKQLAANNDIKNGIYAEAFDYLKSEGFIKVTNTATFLSHEGKKAVEYSVMYPEERTIHFPSYKSMGF